MNLKNGEPRKGIDEPKRIFYVAYFSKERTLGNTLGETWKYPARSLAIPQIRDDPRVRAEWDKQKDIAFFDLNDLFFDFARYPSKKILFTHLGGGFGDIISFSAIAEYLRKKTIRVFTDEKFFFLFKWFSNQDIRLSPHHAIIAEHFTPGNRAERFMNFARLRMEYAAIDGGQRNWYDSMFRRIGIADTPKDYRRPHLVQRTDSFSNVPKKNSILLVHRSSCQMRSSTLADFYFPTREAYPDSKIFVHNHDLTAQDRLFANQMRDNIKIIPECTPEAYFDNLFAASMVVSTDTSAIHFREGVQKPCLAVYGAMSMESRTEGYKYTRSFNVKSYCPFQPCFIHELVKDAVCLNSEEGARTAQCQSGEGFREQLLEELKAYKP